MILRTWAARHGVPFGAILELEQMLGLAGAQVVAPSAPVTGAAPGSESRQQSLIRLEAAQRGYHLFRNNVGALQDRTGALVRYGLANESKKQNQRIKSADLIGWRPVLIEPAHVGCKVAQFVSIEVKEEGHTFDPLDEHQAAQKVWLDLVLSSGGYAKFATGPNEL